MNREEVLNAFKEGRFSLQETLEKIDGSYYQNVGHSTIDFDREARTGAPEVIFGSGKTAQQISDIVDVLLAKETNVLVTRIEEEKYLALSKSLPEQAIYSEEAELLVMDTLTKLGIQLLEQ